MKHDNKQKLIIFSCDNVSTKEQAQSLVEWFQYLGHKIKQVEGVYKGHKEISFVASDSLIDHPLVKQLTKNQESILILEGEQENKRKAWLKYLNSNVLEFLGYWQSTDTIPESDYTYYPLSNTYYNVL
jgi:hypothetical protein